MDNKDLIKRLDNQELALEEVKDSIFDLRPSQTRFTKASQPSIIQSQKC